MKKSDKPVIVEQTFDVPAEELWHAITNPERMRQWFFDNIPDFKPEVGFKTKFNIRSGERDFMHLWEITDVTPLKKITYDWRYDSYSGAGIVEFAITVENEKTKLILTNIIVEDFPDEIPEFKRESCVAGWEYFIKQSLKDYLNK